MGEGSPGRVGWIKAWAGVILRRPVCRGRVLVEELESGRRASAPEKLVHAEARSGPPQATAPSPPTPVRSALGPTAAAAHRTAAPAMSAEVCLEVEGDRWMVRELGRSGSLKAPLVLLGFFRPDAPEEPSREAMVAARAVGDLSELQLEAAWRASIAHVRAGTRRPFFAEISGRGGKDG